jgi:hypothetical protein
LPVPVRFGNWMRAPPLRLAVGLFVFLWLATVTVFFWQSSEMLAVSTPSQSDATVQFFSSNNSLTIIYLDYCDSRALMLLFFFAAGDVVTMRFYVGYQHISTHFFFMLDPREEQQKTLC